MTSLDKLSGEVLDASTAVDAAVHDLRSGAPFATVLVDGSGRSAQAVETVLNRVAEDGTRVVRVANPLRSPLTLERLFLQVVGPEADLRIERSPAELTRLLARPVGKEARLLVVVQQPETLDVDAMQTLGRMAPHFPAVTPSVQFLFCCPPAFQPPEPQPTPNLPALVPVGRVPMVPEEEPEPRRREILPFVLLFLLLAGAGIVIWQAYLEGFSRTRPAIRKTEAAPLTQSATPANPVAPRPPTDEVAALRREFEVFLSQRAPFVAGLSPAQKDALFREFLNRQRQRSAQSGI